MKRILASNPDSSVLVQKVRQGLGMGTACDNVGMPINRPVPGDAGVDGGPDGGFVPGTHYAVDPNDLALIVAWVNAGALNN